MQEITARKGTPNILITATKVKLNLNNPSRHFRLGISVTYTCPSLQAE